MGASEAMKNHRAKQLIKDGKTFRMGSTTFRFTWALFHGIACDRVGWVIGLPYDHYLLQYLMDFTYHT